MINARDLAAQLNVIPRRIRTIAKQLGLVKIGRDWVFSDREAEQIAAHTRKGKAQQKKQK